MMSGSILYPPADPANDIGVLYRDKWLPADGHGTIGTVTITPLKRIGNSKDTGVMT